MSSSLIRFAAVFVCLVAVSYASGNVALGTNNPTGRLNVVPEKAPVITVTCTGVEGGVFGYTEITKPDGSKQLLGVHCNEAQTIVTTRRIRATNSSGITIPGESGLGVRVGDRVPMNAEKQYELRREASRFIDRLRFAPAHEEGVLTELPTQRVVPVPSVDTRDLETGLFWVSHTIEKNGSVISSEMQFDAIELLSRTVLALQEAQRDIAMLQYMVSQHCKLQPADHQQHVPTEQPARTAVWQGGDPRTSAEVSEKATQLYQLYGGGEGGATASQAQGGESAGVAELQGRPNESAR